MYFPYSFAFTFLLINFLFGADNLTNDSTFREVGAPSNQDHRCELSWIGYSQVHTLLVHCISTGSIQYKIINKKFDVLFFI